MRLSRMCLAIAAAFSLASCGLAGPISALPTAPAEIADSVTIDERLGLGAETVYQAAAQAVIFKHKVAPFSEAELARVKMLDAKAIVALENVRRAYRAANAADYKQAYDEVIAISREIVAAVME